MESFENKYLYKVKRKFFDDIIEIIEEFLSLSDSELNTRETRYCHLARKFEELKLVGCQM
jgi:hypothetical protein